jgi:ABC-type antimicrobial peptide transport system permease subunit
MGAIERRLNYQVVGVARDVRYQRVRDDIPPTVYFSLRQAPFVPESISFFLRTSGGPQTLQNEISALALQLDRTVPAVDFRQETGVIERHLSLERAFAGLSTGFAAVGLLLACIGLYGTMAYLVAQRTREIGIRLALGGRPSRVLTGVMTEGLVMTLTGLGLGLAAALALSRVLQDLVFSIRPTDPLTFVAIAALLLVVAVVASYVPARRAMRVDPITVLRE